MSLLLTIKYKDKYILNQQEESGTQVNVNYGGNVVATISSSQNKCLNTKNKAFDDFIIINNHVLNTKDKILDDYVQVISERMPWDTNPKTEAELNLEYTWVVN